MTVEENACHYPSRPTLNECKRLITTVDFRLPVTRPGVILAVARLDLSLSDSAILRQLRSTSGRLPEYQPIRLSMLASDRGAMHATRARYTQTRPLRAALQQLRRELKHRAVNVLGTSTRRSVEIASRQSQRGIGSSAVAASLETIQKALGPGAALRRWWVQLEYCATSARSGA